MINDYAAQKLADELAGRRQEEAHRWRLARLARCCRPSAWRAAARRVLGSRRTQLSERRSQRCVCVDMAAAREFKRG